MNEEQLQNQPTGQQPASGIFTYRRIGKYLIIAVCVYSLYCLLAPYFVNHPRSRRLPSVNNLKNIGIAMHNFASQNNDKLPPGATVDATEKPLHSWATVLLPNVDQLALDRAINHNIPWNAPANAKHFQTEISVFINPGLDETKTGDGYAQSHYSANKNIFFNNSEVLIDEILKGDGVGQTILAGEIVENLPAWGDPANRRDLALGLNKSPHGFGSPSLGLVNVVFADGRAKSISDDIDPEILKALSTPNGGEEIDPSEF